MAAEVAELISLGERLNYEGEELSRFVKEQQNLLREERAAKRAEEKAQLELEVFKLQADKEENRLLMELRLEEAKRTPLPDSESEVGDDSGSGSKRVMDSWAFKLIPKFVEADVLKFFSAFEKVAKQMDWKKEMWSVLVQSVFVGRAQVVYASLNEADSKDYEVVKSAVLDAYEMVPEAHRQRFRKLQRHGKQTYWEFARDKEVLLNEWLRSLKVSDFAGLKEVLLIEDFKNGLPYDLRKHVEEFDLKTLENVAKAADRFELTHKSSNKSYLSDRRYSSKFSSFDKPGYGNKVWSDGKNYPMADVKCFSCGKTGHKQRFCKWKGKVAFIAEKKVKENGNVGCKIAEKDRVMYGDFITEGWLKVDENALDAKNICALRDTGASHSCVLRSLVPDHKLENVKEFVLLGGFPDSVTSCPVVELYLDIGYVRSLVKLAVVESLPVVGVDILVGNDTTRNKSEITDIIQINLQHEGKMLAVTRSQDKEEETKVSNEEAGEKEEVLVWDDSMWNREVFLKEQKEDKTLTKLWREATENDSEDLSKPKMVVKEELLFRKTRNKYVKHESGNISWQIVVPRVYRKKLLSEAHESPWSGHFGVDKTFRHLVSNFWWPGVKQDVKRNISTCPECQVVGKPNDRIPKAPLHPIRVSGNPFSHLVLDIVGPLPKSSGGHEYILTIIDRITRYPEAIPIRKVSSKVIINHLIQYFSHFGFPLSIQTDRGTYFTSKEFTQQLRVWNVEQKLSTPYHPESQGIVERLHLTIKNSLTKYCHSNIAKWDKQLPYVLFALRSLHNVSLGFSPFQLIFGHEVNGPMELLRDKLVDATMRDNSIEQWLTSKERLQETREWSQKNLTQAQIVMKENADKKSKLRSFEVGDSVLVLLPAPGQLRVKYTGPGIVERKVNDLNYEVSIPGRKQKSQTFHVNLLKLFKKRDNEDIIQVVAIEEVNEHAEVEKDILQISSKVDYMWASMNKESVKLLEEKLNHLDETKHLELYNLCNKYHEIFSEKLGSATMTQHEVKLKPGSTPIHQSPYKLNPMKAKEVKSQIQYMLEQGLIERSKSPWSSPVVLVPKKEGGYRLCIDYRKVNEMTIADCFPIPRIEECIEKIGNASFVSKIDLLKGYWQIPLADKAKEISAFVTPEGLFQCKVMPFGMKNSSSTFQRMMTEITSNLSNCTVYLDDIVVYNDTWNNHLLELEKLFVELSRNNLVVNLEKSEFAHAQIIYLGHKVGSGQIAPKLSNVEVILNFPTPSNRKQVRQFLGLCGYYRRYVPNFANIAYPLTDLLKKDRKFVITAEVETSIKQIKTILSSPPILRTPNWTRPFELMVDASNLGIGAVLCQEENGIKHPIAFFSKKLNKHQLNYSTIEKECLALVTALQYFEIYLTNGEYVTKVYSDHNPLIYIHKFKNKNRRLMSWSWVVQEYNFQMHHIKGKINTVADTLSRVFHN